ncbi:phage holin family protein [Dehalococcoides sp. THU3]|uniref:phage holin family protein n=1 Tax=Dehalococcoides TaxID=61434 RepID=UPI003218B946
MKSIWMSIQLGLSAAGAYVGYFLGGWDGFLYALVTFVVIDYITGLMVAILDKKLSSDTGFRGIFKKVLIFVMVGIGHIFDAQLIGDGSALRTAVIFFYISNEGISILENSSRIGLPIPQKIKDILGQLHNKGGSDS